MTFEHNLNIYVHVAKGSVFGMILSEPLEHTKEATTDNIHL